MKTQKQTATKRQLNQCMKKHNTWKLSTASHSLTKKVALDSPVSALALIARITVLAHVTDVFPHFSLHESSLAIVLKASRANPLTLAHLDMVARIDSIGLLTDSR